VQEARRYILGNWERIMRQYEADYTGCSVEEKAAVNEARQVKSRT